MPQPFVTLRAFRGHRRARAGVSLMEVLISIFVLLFGLLGVASLFPVGQFYVQKANTYDRAASVGQTAFNEIRVRGLIQPLNVDDGGGNEKNWVLVNGNQIPVNSVTPPLQVDPYATGALTGMTLVTLPGLTSPNAAVSGAADVVFLSHDDLVFELPDDTDLPAFQSAADQRPFQGDYSWMFTLTADNNNPEQGVVSVVVFHKRVPSGDRSTTISTAGGGYGGGDLQVSVQGVELDENLRAGRWVLLSRTNAADNFYKWYRILAAEPAPDPVSYPHSRRITLAGPDWNTNWNMTPAQFALGVPDSAVGVYEKTMSLEDSTSAWGFQ